MPHVIVKLWPCKSERQKSQLAGAITDAVTRTLGYGEESVSVAFEEVSAADWDAQVYETDILAKWGSLAKEPGYGRRPTER